jgi:glyceraldehyde 3-phosphate dehydrogenase
MSGVVIDRAVPADHDLVRALLTRSGLPLDGLDAAWPAMLVARRGHAVLGCAALEFYADGALLRSVAVAEEARGLGLGQRLTQAAAGLARDHRARALYLLTTTADRYFPRLGFERIARADVPASVQASVEFASACPASATVMRKALGDEPSPARAAGGGTRRPVRIGINGFGRMGRLALRAGWGRADLEFVHVNEIAGGSEVAAHLLTFDSVHGRWGREVRSTPDALSIDGAPVRFSSQARPGDVPWSASDVDIVLECSGKFRTVETLEPYFAAGVKRVIVAAPVKSGALNIVMGVNDHLYHPARDRIVTAASCTTNCLAPVVKVVHETLGIRHGVITTVHDMTNTQAIVDAPHKDLRRARASSLSLIPTSTGSATAIGLIYPELQGKLSGLAVRVPLLNASLTDCVFEVARPTTVDEVNAALRQAAEGPLAGILGYEARPLVSVDYKDDPRSSIVDALSTMVIDGTCVKILAWYDNEIGYVHRMVELAQMVGATL